MQNLGNCMIHLLSSRTLLEINIDLQLNELGIYYEDV